MNKEIIGIFDGEHMIAEDGKKYPVFGNYASKSMLVQGDELKLIMDDGEFTYKQLTKVDRQRVIMKVINGTGYVRSTKKLINEKGKIYGILPATINFFRLEVDDEVVAIIPRGGDTYFAAVEMVTNK
jgi:hypothetical protein